MNTHDSTKRPRLWTKWAMLLLFLFLAFESSLLAVTFKGPWLVLLAPGAVCVVKAIDTWRDLRRHLGPDRS